MLWSVIRLIFKTSSVIPDFFYVFNLVLSFSTCRQSFKKSVRGNFWARTSLIPLKSLLLPNDSHIVSFFSARDEILFRLHDNFSDFLARLAGLNPSPCNRQFDFKRICFTSRAEISAWAEICHVTRPYLKWTSMPSEYSNDPVLSNQFLRSRGWPLYTGLTVILKALLNWGSKDNQFHSNTMSWSVGQSLGRSPEHSNTLTVRW